MNKTLSDQLDKKANGADDVELNGKKYVRRGPKNSISDPGPWREVKESLDLIKELMHLNESNEEVELKEAIVEHELFFTDSRDLSDETAKELKKILRKLGIFTYDLPSARSSDTHAIIFSKKSLTPKEIKDFYEVE